MANHQHKTWANRTPEEREQIAINRSRASYHNPFNGKNSKQRERLHQGFNAMASIWAKLGSR